MTGRAVAQGREKDGAVPDTLSVLNALPNAVLVMDTANKVRLTNPAAEQLFGAGTTHLQTRTLADLISYDSPLILLVERVRAHGETVSEYGLGLDLPRLGTRMVDVQLGPLVEAPGWVLMSFVETSVPRMIERQLSHRSAARSVSGMASMLAHEVKNPLSGIRGAAQLLEHTANAEERSLTQLICDETDRICALVDRMDAFAEGGVLDKEAVNIHRVIEHVLRVARAGFARDIRIVENYDPSLPPLHGNRDQLVQALLNLVKNAAEAVPAAGGEIIVTTAYQHGLRLAMSGGESRRDLPIVVSIQDNGPGIPEDIKSNLFEPFVTAKPNGTGLGLALVAKVVDDHGGVIEVDSAPRRTVFRLRLRVFEDGGKAP